MAKEDLGTLVATVVELEEGKPFSESKKVAKKRKGLREKIQEALLDGKELPPDSEYFAELRGRPGRVPYREIIDNLVIDHPELRGKVDEMIEAYRNQQRYRLLYGRRE